MTTPSLLDDNATAHDAIACAHFVASLPDDDDDDDAHRQNAKLAEFFFREIEEKAFRLFLKRGDAEARDANGLTPMQLYALLGMNGNEKFEKYFVERVFLHPIEAVLASSREEKRVQIEKFKRNLFCHRDEGDDKNNRAKGENMLLMQVHACNMNDLACLRRIIHLENEMIQLAAHPTCPFPMREYTLSSLQFNAPLLAAALRHPHDASYRLVEFILKRYAEFDGTGLSEPLDSFGRNALHLCAQYDSPKTMRLVMNHLSSRYAHKLNDIINCRDAFSDDYDGNRTPLMTACSFSPDCALLLIEKFGADASTMRSKAGWSALFYAIEQQFRDYDIDSDDDVAKQNRLIRLLMKNRDMYRQQNPTTKTDPGVEENAMKKNILHLAAINARSTRPLEILLKSKSIVQSFLSHPDANGKTPLHDAMFRSCINQALYLVDAIENEKESQRKSNTGGTNIDDAILAEELQDCFGKSQYSGIVCSRKLFRNFPNDFDPRNSENPTLAEKTLEYYEDKLLFQN